MLTAASDATHHNHHPVQPAEHLFALSGWWWAVAHLDVWTLVGNYPIIIDETRHY